MKRPGEVRSSRRWLDWRPDPILADLGQTEPSKPTEPGFEGFVGSLSGTPAKIVCGKPGPADTGSAPNAINPIGSEVDSASRRERLMSWSEWKAACLNRLFLEQGAIGQSGRITAETVRHGCHGHARSRKD